MSVCYAAPKVMQSVDTMLKPDPGGPYERLSDGKHEPRDRELMLAAWPSERGGTYVVKVCKHCGALYLE